MKNTAAAGCRVFSGTMEASPLERDFLNNWNVDQFEELY